VQVGGGGLATRRVQLDTGKVTEMCKGGMRWEGTCSQCGTKVRGGGDRDYRPPEGPVLCMGCIAVSAADTKEECNESTDEQADTR
jgi:hypothetical protein